MKVQIMLDGNVEEFEAKQVKRGVYRIHQNEGLFTSEFVDAVRRYRRWPRHDEVLEYNDSGDKMIFVSVRSEDK